MAQNILINNSHGRDNVEKATIVMTIANVASTKEGRTMMFLTGQGIYLATKDGADGMHLKGYRSVGELRESYIANGGRFWVCKACADAYGLTADDLIESAALAGASDTIAYLQNGGQLLM